MASRGFSLRGVLVIAPAEKCLCPRYRELVKRPRGKDLRSASDECLFKLRHLPDLAVNTAFTSLLADAFSCRRHRTHRATSAFMIEDIRRQRCRSSFLLTPQPLVYHGAPLRISKLADCTQMCWSLNVAGQVDHKNECPGSQDRCLSCGLGSRGVSHLHGRSPFFTKHQKTDFFNEP